MSKAFRINITACLALAGAGAVVVTQAPPPEIQPHAVQLTSTVGLVMGGSGLPLPNYDRPDYVGLADQFYIHPNFPDTTYLDPYTNGLFTPEGFYPFSGVHNLLVDYPIATSGPLAGFPALSTSMGQGMLILENAIGSNTAAGDGSTVFGWSQSSVISGLVMQQLDPSGTPRPDDGLQFALVGDLGNPNGGIFERFDGLNLPSLGASFTGPTPPDDYPTDIYTLEYDGWADFPKYPIDLLADLNALLGMFDIHGLYLTSSVMTSALQHAILLPGSEALGADSLTNYYMIPLSALPAPSDYLPLLLSLLNIPVIGKPLADLLQPDLTVLVNLGYGADNLGYSTTPDANVPTPFGVFPDVNPATVLSELATGAGQGLRAFAADLSLHSLSSLLSEASQSAHTGTTDLMILPTTLSTDLHDPSTALTDFLAKLSTEASVLYSTITPSLDIANSVLTVLPPYDLSLFLHHLSDPVDAIGLPIAASVGLLSLAAGLELNSVVVGTLLTGGITL